MEMKKTIKEKNYSSPLLQKPVFLEQITYMQLM